MNRAFKQPRAIPSLSSLISDAVIDVVRYLSWDTYKKRQTANCYKWYSISLIEWYNVMCRIWSYLKPPTHPLFEQIVILHSYCLFYWVYGPGNNQLTEQKT